MNQIVVSTYTYYAAIYIYIIIIYRVSWARVGTYNIIYIIVVIVVGISYLYKSVNVIVRKHVTNDMNV